MIAWYNLRMRCLPFFNFPNRFATTSDTLEFIPEHILNIITFLSLQSLNVFPQPIILFHQNSQVQMDILFMVFTNPNAPVSLHWWAMENNRQLYNSRRNMSHLITGLSVSPEPLLDKNPLREIVAPKFKHVLKDNDTSHVKTHEAWKEEIAISRLCKKLSDREFSILRKQNATQIEHHFARLKSKIRRHAQPNAPSVTKFFEGSKQSTSLNVKYLLQKMPQKISLASKYNHRLVAFAESLNDVRQISQDKENYTQWLDNRNNSPVTSPNYCRMSFVLERLAKSHRYSEFAEGGTRDGPKKGKDGLASSFLAYRNEGEYKPKGRRVRTLAQESSLLK